MSTKYYKKARPIEGTRGVVVTHEDGREETLSLSKAYPIIEEIQKREEAERIRKFEEKVDNIFSTLLAVLIWAPRWIPIIGWIAHRGVCLADGLPTCQSFKYYKKALKQQHRAERERYKANEEWAKKEENE